MAGDLKGGSFDWSWIMITLTCPGQFGFCWFHRFQMMNQFVWASSGMEISAVVIVFWPFEGSGSPRWNCNQLVLRLQKKANFE